MNIIYETPGGDSLRIAELDTPHPRIERQGRNSFGDEWFAVHPKEVPCTMFGMVVDLLRFVCAQHDDMCAEDDGRGSRLIEAGELVDAGFRVEEETP